MSTSPDTPDPTPSAGRPRRRWGLWGYLGGTLLIGTLGAGGVCLWHWAGQDGSLARALALAQPWTPAALTVNGASGSLRHGGQIAELRWQQDGLDVRAQHLRWSMDEASAWALWQDRALPISALHVQHVAVRDQRPPQASVPPPPLLWPWVRRAALDWSIGELQIETASPLRLSARGHYSYERDQSADHQLRFDELQWAEGRYSGLVQLSEGEERSLQATLTGQVPVALPSGGQDTLQVLAEAQGRLPPTPHATVPDWGLRVQAQTSARDDGPSLNLHAGLQPWHTDTPLVQAQAQLRALNLAWLWPQAPSTQLDGSAQVRPDGTALDLQLDLRNRRSGPADQGLLPVQDAQVQARWQAPTLTIGRADIGAGGGRLQAQGTWHHNGAPWTGELKVQAVSLRALWSALPAEPVSAEASASATAEGVRLRASASLPREGHQPVLRGEGLWHTQGRDAGRIDVDSAWVRWRGLALDGQGQWHPQRRQAQGDVALALDQNRASANGHWSPQGGQGEWQLDMPQLQSLSDILQRWATLPLLSRPLQALHLPALQGALQGQGQWSGGWPQLSWNARWSARDLAVGGLPFTSPTLGLDISGHGTSARWQWQGQHRSANLPWRSEAQGGWALNGGTHQLGLNSLQLRSDATQATDRWRLQLHGPTALSAQAGSTGWALHAELASWRLHSGDSAQAPAELSWTELRWDNSGLRSQGGWRRLPLVWADALQRSWQNVSGAAPSPGPLARAGLGGDLSLQGQWRLQLSPDPLASEARLSVAREAGDLRVDLPGLSAEQRQAGIDTLALDWALQQGHSRLSAQWASRRMGRASAEANTPLRLAWPLSEAAWPADSPISGRLQADLPDLTLWQSLAPPGWRAQGRLQLQAQLGGSRAQPDWSGEVQGTALGLTSAINGLRFEQGELQARLQGDHLQVQRLRIHGAGGPEAGGTLTAQGEASWTTEQGVRVPLLRLQAQADRLRVSNRPDQKLSVSGHTDAQLQGQRLRLRGDIRATEALFVLPDDSGPQLGSDVVVRGGRVGSAARSDNAGSAKPLIPDVLVTLDLGERFEVRGRGLQTRLTGQLQLRSTEQLPSPRLQGEVRTVGGSYRAYGQDLRIQNGVLRFAGPFDDPALDITAVRSHTDAGIDLVGVKVTGSAQAPRATLVSEPNLPDSEKLAWLVLGRPATGAGAEAAILQQAALALLLGQGGGPGGDIALRLGLDELNLRGPREQADGSTQAASLTLGKRLSDKLYLSYEHSLGGTLGTLSMLYDLSRRLTLRAQAGNTQAIDLIFTLRYD